MDARLLLSAIRSANAGYPIPYVFSVSLGFGVLCLGGAILSSDWLLILLAALGTFVIKQHRAGGVRCSLRT